MSMLVTIPYFTRLLTIAFLLFLCACTKNSASEQKQIFSGTYTSENTAYLDKPVLYAAGKKIDDPEFIQAFLKRAGYLDSGLLFNQTTESLPDHSNEIDFFDSGHVVLHGISGFINGLIVPGSSNEILIESKDTTTIYIYQSISRCDLLEEEVNGIKPVKICESPSSNLCKLIPRVSLRHDNGKLVLTLMSYLLSNYHTVSEPACWTSYSNFWNSFDKNAPNQLSTYDTIVIQTKTIYLSK